MIIRWYRIIRYDVSSPIPYPPSSDLSPSSPSSPSSSSSSSSSNFRIILCG
jgi:hypothetical protein